jgi:hypothetical protein
MRRTEKGTTVIDRNARARLEALEEKVRRLDEQRQGTKRSIPEHEEWVALNQGYDAWVDLMHRYGWTHEEIEADNEWTLTLADRIKAANFDDVDVIRDMCAFVDAQNLPLSEMRDAFDRYPGPGFWGPGGGV